MTYRETLDYLFSQLPMYHRIGPAALKPDLKNTQAILELLDHPEADFRTIHIAGTNGKGSVSNMIAAMLQAHGYRTGLFTSPHLKDFRERIRINGQMIPQAAVTRFVKKYRKTFDDIQPSFFEWTTGLAFDYFSRSDVDIAVIETGLGGRLDSTNVITPLVSVITNVQWDHMHLLGNTLTKIAREKAGIIKPGVPVVLGTMPAAVQSVMRSTAKKLKAPVYKASDWYQVRMDADAEPPPGKLQVSIDRKKKAWIREQVLDLGGWYQLNNVPIALTAFELLEPHGFESDRKHIRKALSNVRKLTGFAGRWQVIDKQPLTVCDTGHNVDGINEVMRQLQQLDYNRLHVVLGMVVDKDADAILKLLPRQADYYFCKPDIPRGMDARALRKLGVAHKLNGHAYASVKQALEAAQEKAGRNDLIYVGGSTFVVAEVL